MSVDGELVVATRCAERRSCPRHDRHHSSGPSVVTRREVREEYQAPRRQTRLSLGTRLEQLPLAPGRAGGSHRRLRGCRGSLARRGAGGGARAGPGHDSLFWLARRRR